MGVSTRLLGAALAASAVIALSSGPASAERAPAPPAAPSAAAVDSSEIVLVQFDHTLSSVDQERFELRHYVRFVSYDAGRDVYAFTPADGTTPDMKAGAIRRNNRDGVIWVGLGNDTPPPLQRQESQPAWILAGAVLALGALLAAALVGWRLVARWRTKPGASHGRTPGRSARRGARARP